MSKKSGYQIRLDLFIEAAPFDPEALALARERINKIVAQIKDHGFFVIDYDEKPRNRMEIPDAASTAANAGGPSATASIGTGATQPPPIPPSLKR